MSAKLGFVAAAEISAWIVLATGCVDRTHGSTPGSAAPPDALISLPFGAPFRDDRPHRTALDSDEMTAFKMALARVTFPQPGGTVLKMLPGRFFPSLEMVGDAFGERNGLMGVYARTYDLNMEEELLIVEEHYSRGVVDRSAVVKRKNSEKKPNQALEPTPMPVTSPAQESRRP